MSRVKALLTPFFKIAHPDVLRSAPDHVQKMNGSALANLNSYIDSISHGQGVGLSSLNFFVPSGLGKYRECKVALLPLRQESSSSARSFHLESLINSINQAITNPAVEEVEEVREAKQRPKTKHDLWNLYTETLQKYHLFDQSRSRLEKINEDVAGRFERSYVKNYPTDPGLKNRKTDALIRSAVKSSLSQTMYKGLLKNVNRLEKLFIDKDLAEEEVNLGLFNFAGNNLSIEDRVELKEFCEGVIRDSGIVISNRYSVSNVPGALQVPFNFNLREMKEFYSQNKEELKERLNDMFLFKDKTEKVLKYLSSVLVPCTLGRYLYQNNEKYEKQMFSQTFAAAQKLKNLIENGKVKGLTDCVIVIGVEYRKDKGFLEIPLRFNEEQLIKFIQNS